MERSKSEYLRPVSRIVCSQCECVKRRNQRGKTAGFCWLPLLFAEMGTSVMALFQSASKAAESPQKDLHRFHKAQTVPFKQCTTLISAQPIVAIKPCLRRLATHGGNYEWQAMVSAESRTMLTMGDNRPRQAPLKYKQRVSKSVSAAMPAQGLSIQQCQSSLLCGHFPALQKGCLVERWSAQVSGECQP